MSNESKIPEHFKYGLCGRFRMIDGESSQDFNQILTWMLTENPPQSTEEAILVSKLAEHFWLAQRAQLLQVNVFDLANCEGAMGVRPRNERDKELALYIRYAASNDRSFHKCMDQLRKIRGKREKEQIGFERQKREEAAEIRKQEAHEANIKKITLKACKDGRNPDRPEVVNVENDVVSRSSEVIQILGLARR